MRQDEQGRWVSDDGQWIWDGNAWQPREAGGVAPSAPAAADPAATQLYASTDDSSATRIMPGFSEADVAHGVAGGQGGPSGAGAHVADTSKFDAQPEPRGPGVEATAAWQPDFSDEEDFRRAEPGVRGAGAEGAAPSETAPSGGAETPGVAPTQIAGSGYGAAAPGGWAPAGSGEHGGGGGYGPGGYSPGGSGTVPYGASGAGTASYGAGGSGTAPYGASGAGTASYGAGGSGTAPYGASGSGTAVPPGAAGYGAAGYGAAYGAAGHDQGAQLGQQFGQAPPAPYGSGAVGQAGAPVQAGGPAQSQYAGAPWPPPGGPSAGQPRRRRPAWLVPLIAALIVIGIAVAVFFLLRSDNKSSSSSSSASSSPAGAAPAPLTESPLPTSLPGTFSVATERNFMNACVAGANGPYCTCALTALENDFTQDAFITFEQQFSAGDPAARAQLQQIKDSCRSQLPGG